MSLSDRYRKWLEQVTNVPADRIATALEAVDAFESCAQETDRAELRKLVVAASSPHTIVFDTGCTLLVRMSIESTDAQECLLGMMKDKNSTARFHAVAYLSPELPEALRQEIVGQALCDRSSKVKIKGIEGAEKYKFAHFLPRLLEMEQSEANDRVKQALKFHIPLLRDGFLLERTEDGEGYQLTVRGENFLGGPFISKAKYSEEFVRQEIERMQARDN